MLKDTGTNKRGATRVVSPYVLMKSKIALIPLLGVLFTMAPLAAFADVVPHITVNGGNTVYNDQGTWNNNLDWTCTGLGDDGNGHFYVAMPYSDNNHASYSGEITDCSTGSRNAFLNQVSGIGIDATYHWAIWDDNNSDLWDFFNQYALYAPDNYEDLFQSPATWIAETGDVTMSSEDTP